MGDTTEVGKYPNGTSRYSALDMAGNIWEWVSSLDKPYLYSATHGREDLSASGGQVFRGGSWESGVKDLLSANRIKGDPMSSYNDIGFRCAMSATP